VPAVKKTAAKKAPAKKTNEKKQVVLLGPTYNDQKIDTLVKRFESTVKAMSAEAVKTVKAFHANKLELVKSGSFGIHDAAAMHSIYPPLCLSQYLEMHWDLMRALVKHHVSPTKRNENSVIARRETLLDHLDHWEIEPLYRAWQEREDRGAGSKEYRTYLAAKREQRRVRLGLSETQFAQLLKKEKAEYEAHQAQITAQFDADRAAERAAARKKPAKSLA